MTRNGEVLNWCLNDCHPMPMWFFRRNCLNRAEFKRKMEEKESEEEKSSGKVKASKDLKLALKAILKACNCDDFESQCLKQWVGRCSLTK